MRALLTATTALLLTLAAGTALAQDAARGRPDRASTAATSTLAAADKMFVEEAAQAGLLEVQASKLAEQKARRGDVKELARHLVEDHTMANDKLKAIAARKGITLAK